MEDEEKTPSLSTLGGNMGDFFKVSHVVWYVVIPFGLALTFVGFILYREMFLVRLVGSRAVQHARIELRRAVLVLFRYGFDFTRFNF